MRYYEILYIINPNFEKKKIDSAMEDINDRLKKTKSNIINHIIWGKKRLAYSMQGHKYGTYILLHYESGDSEKLEEFYSWLKLSTLVVRHMVVRLNDKPELIENKNDEDSSGDSNVDEDSSEDSNVDEDSSEDSNVDEDSSEDSNVDEDTSEEKNKEEL